MGDDAGARRREIAELRARLEALEAAEQNEPAPTVEPVPSDDTLSTHVRGLSSPAKSEGIDKETLQLILIVGAVIAMTFLLAMCTVSGGRKSSEASAPASAASPVVAAPTQPAAPAEPTYAWRYREETDGLTDKTVYQSCLESTSRIDLNWPYKSQYPRLCVRQSPKFGRDVIVSLVEGGQFICSSYDGCTAKVRFDDGPIQAFTMMGPSDHSSDTLFVSNDTRFLAAMRKAKRVRISTNLYEAGEQTMDFPVEGFDAARAGIN